MAFFDDPNAKKLGYRMDALAAGAAALRDGSAEPMWLVATVQTLAADVTAIRIALAALTSTGTSLDAATLLNRMDALAAEEKARDTAAQKRIAELEAELERVRAAAEANLSDAEKATLPPVA